MSDATGDGGVFAPREGAGESTSFDFPPSREHSTTIMGGVFGSSAWVPASLTRSVLMGRLYVSQGLGSSPVKWAEFV